ncbi:hypothetical protein GWC95_06105 [Sediminibacterium roseum]|uniref:Uncharacterized protein n=1 Tax=Sediminibacterium roseum TaxID=1978412 RepID=A0ABW9ZQW3_9BACT|nr:hypothetical protein [Sediminibacterium roseum]NCI49488.1 hypothetical protein [Sediminibacterium roseum]
MRLRLTIFAGILVLNIQLLLAQATLPKVSVDVDPGSAVFTGAVGLPFDVPFNIRGPIAENLKKVTLTYKVNSYKKWMSAADKNLHTTSPWTKEAGRSSADNKFTLAMEAIYPNTSYTFHFRFFSTPIIDATKKKTLYGSLFNSIDAYIKGHDFTNPASLSNELNTQITKMIGSKLYDETGNEYKVNAMDPEMQKFTRQMIDIQNQITKDSTNIYAAIPSCEDPRYAGFLSRLKTLRSDTGLLNATTKAMLKAPVSVDLADFKTLTMTDLVKLWVDPTKPIQAVLKGLRKIENGRTIAVNEFHEPSAKLLTAFLTVLDNKEIRKKDGVNYFQPDEAFIRELLINVDNIIGLQADWHSQIVTRSKLVDEFPDIIASHYVISSFDVQDRSNPDVTAQDNAYIGLDFGFADTYAYGHQIFLYEGVNFYLVPINKNAPLSTIHGFWRQVAKRFSIHLGLTQSVMGTPNKLYEPLINNVGSIMIGAGFRINRFIHVNWGEMLFFEKDVNPLIDHKRLAYRPTASVTFDLVSMKAIGNFLTKIGIK